MKKQCYIQFSEYSEILLAPKLLHRLENIDVSIYISIFSPYITLILLKPSYFNSLKVLPYFQKFSICQLKLNPIIVYYFLELPNKYI